MVLCEFFGTYLKMVLLQNSTMWGGVMRGPPVILYLLPREPSEILKAHSNKHKIACKKLLLNNLINKLRVIFYKQTFACCYVPWGLQKTLLAEGTVLR